MHFIDIGHKFQKINPPQELFSFPIIDTPPIHVYLYFLCTVVLFLNFSLIVSGFEWKNELEP